MSEAKQRTLNLTMSASTQSLPLDGRILTPEMTAEALNTFRGPQGPQGERGADGTMTFEELTDEQKESLRGPQGPQGPKGEKGDPGTASITELTPSLTSGTVIGVVIIDGKEYTLYAPTPPVSSVNGKTGAVTLSAGDVGARASDWMPGYADVGAAAASHTHSYLPLSGGTMTGDIFMNARMIYWKESGYGDKFAIVPAFSGTDDANVLKIQGSVGDAGTDPALVDLVTIAGKTGTMKIGGNTVHHNGNLTFSLSGTTLTITKS